MTKETLETYDSYLSEVLLQWFNDNIKEIFCFCFASGLASNTNEWADIVWYRNELDENDMDDMFNIKDVMDRISPTAEYGTRTGGSTIQLPLLDTLIANKDGCVGMAANMIGVRKRIIVFDNEGTYMTMFNPVIIKKSGAYDTEEGCFSLLGGPRPCKRYQTIKIQ